jgi:hypothetical protein
MGYPLVGIGTVDALLIGKDARVVGVVVEVGGFLGVGARRVVVPMTQLGMIDDDNVRQHGRDPRAARDRTGLRAPSPAGRLREKRMDKRIDDDRRIDPTEARAGVKIGRGRMRLVLGTSIAAVAVGFLIAWLVA